MFADQRHNLYVGWIFGIALKYDLPMEPVTDNDGNFTDRMRLHLPDQMTIEVVIPRPPDDWQLVDDRKLASR